ncbi:EPIDERMAL PATTERNING FACTOR-like protein 2 [Miscanthus floridulus]|uniref:EPIDERMAL PATTERNING FACTOR-like protein 2 n=1 Tax=Miscanthus floridulus TaxID=154761 RepID=UPI00345A743B
MDHRHVFLVSLALLLVATTHAAGGHATQAAAAAAMTQQGTDGVVGSMIGSEPPSCKGMCGWWCVGRSCEAVLVPIEPPQDNKQSRRHGGGGGGDGSRASAAAAQHHRRPSSYDDDDHADYKPITWRCKCVGAS